MFLYKLPQICDAPQIQNVVLYQGEASTSPSPRSVYCGGGNTALA